MKFSVDGQEHHLWVASRRYMRGEITMAELEEEERHHALRFRKAVIKHAKRRETRRAVDAVVAAIVRVVKERPSSTRTI